MIKTKFPTGGHARRPLLQFYFDGREERAKLLVHPRVKVSVKVTFTAEQTRILRILIDARQMDRSPNSLLEGYRTYAYIAEANRVLANYEITPNAVSRAKRRINRHIAKCVRGVAENLPVPELFQSKRGEGIRIAPYICIVADIESHHE